MLQKDVREVVKEPKLKNKLFPVICYYEIANANKDACADADINIEDHNEYKKQNFINITTKYFYMLLNC